MIDLRQAPQARACLREEGKTCREHACEAFTLFLRAGSCPQALPLFLRAGSCPQVPSHTHTHASRGVDKDYDKDYDKDISRNQAP